MMSSSTPSSGIARYMRKNMSGSRTDKGWDHGVDVDGGGRKVQCKYCGKTFTGGIFRLKNHLACSHNNVEGCISAPDEVREEFVGLLVKTAELGKRKQRSFHDYEDAGGSSKVKSLSAGCSSKQSTINQLMKKDMREDVCEQIARFLYTSAIPFNAVNNPEFEKMVEKIGRYGVGLKTPSYYEIREKYLKKEVGKTTKMLDDYKAEWKRTGCSIMSDGWSDRRHRSIVNFMVNSPKGFVFISSLDTSGVSKTAEVICDMLDKVVDIVGEENVVQIITDNAANYKAGGELLMERRKKLFWTSCAAHCIDLMLEDFDKKLELHGETIKKGKSITTFIYNSSFLIDMMRNFTKGKELLRPATTRFATSYLTLGSLGEQKGALMAMFSSSAWKNSSYTKTNRGKYVQKIVLDGEFWKNVVMCLKASYPLVKVLRMVDAEEKPAMGYIFHAMDKAKEKISESFKNVKKSYEPIWNIIDYRWEVQMHRPLHAAAYFLNLQMQYNPEFQANSDVKLGLYQVMRRLVPDPLVRRKMDVQIEQFKQATGLFGIEEAIVARETKLPHIWWDAYGDDCPELQKFAIRVLSLTCSSSGCERNWSSFEMVQSKKRNRLEQKRMNDLVFVMYNLKLQSRKPRKNKELSVPIVEEDIDMDDDWVADENGLEDSQIPRLSHFSRYLSESRQENEEEDLEAILGASSIQQNTEDDDLVIPNVEFEYGSSGRVDSVGEAGDDGENRSLSDDICTDYI